MKKLSPTTQKFLLMYAVWVVIFFKLTGGGSDPLGWIESWRQWDSIWYEKIWNEGYPAADPRALVFPPGYSMTIGTLSTISPFNFAQAAIFANLVFYFLALMMISKIAEARFRANPLAVFAFGLTLPSAYFVFAFYSDAFFMFIMTWALYLALGLGPGSPRQKKILEYGLVLVAPWARLTGFALASWLVVRRWSGLMVFISLAGWLGLNTLLGGSPFYFLKAQKLFSMPEGNFLEGMRSAFGGLIPNTASADFSWTPYLQFNLLPVFYLIALLGATAWFAVKRERLIAVTILAILLISHNQVFWRSTVRYDLPLMPYLAIPLLCGNLKWQKLCYASLILIGLIQLYGQIVFGNLFRIGHWAF